MPERDGRESCTRQMYLEPLKGAVTLVKQCVLYYMIFTTIKISFKKRSCPPSNAERRRQILYLVQWPVFEVGTDIAVGHFRHDHR